MPAGRDHLRRDEPSVVAAESGLGHGPMYGPTHEHGCHCLRHTFAGVPPDAREKLVAATEWLGHAGTSARPRGYGRFLPDADSRGREAMGA